MNTICVVHGSQGTDGKSQVYGAVLGEANEVRGALQQHIKAIGSISNRAHFNQFVQRNKLKLAACTPIDIADV